MQKRHPHSEETKRKISEALRGNKNSAGRVCTEEHREKLSQSKLGKPLPLAVRQKIVETMKRRGIKPRAPYHPSGEDHHNWKGGMSALHKTERQLAMQTMKYKEWRKSVFERDGYQCKIGGKLHGYKLNADHIKSWAQYPELRYEVDNGQTLCEDCHRKTESYGNRNKPYGLSVNQPINQ